MEAVVKGQWRDWMTKLGINSAQAEALGYFYRTGTGLTLPAWVEGFPLPLQTHQGFASGNPAGKWLVWCSVTQAVDMISRSIAADTVLRDPGSYPLVAPPPGIAAFLLAAMTEVSYEGVIEVDGYQGYARHVGRVVSIEGGPTELETARALTREQSHNLQTGAWSLQTGQSSAGSGLEMLSRFRRIDAR